MSEQKQEEPKQEEKPQPKQEEPQQPQLAQIAQMNETIAQLVKAQEENKKTIEMLAKAIVEVNKKAEAKPSGTSGGDNPLAFLAELAKPKGGTIEEFAKQAQAFAIAADAMEHFRRPVLPYSPSDRFLMRAGATAVRKIVYEGVKGRKEEELSDKEIDRILGFSEEEKEERKHVSE